MIGTMNISRVAKACAYRTRCFPKLISRYASIMCVSKESSKQTRNVVLVNRTNSFVVEYNKSIRSSDVCGSYFLSARKLFTTCRCLCERDSEDSDSESENSSDEEIEDTEEDEQYQEMSREVYRLIPGMGHKVLLILPKIKWGPKKKTNTTPELQLAEGVALVETLEHWQVTQKVVVNCLSPDKKYIFGRGNLEKIEQLAGSSSVTAVFVNQNSLTGIQLASLESVVGKPIYDRHTIVLMIFLEHAKSKEAKLQVALAEIPYLRRHLRGLHERGFERVLGSMKHVGGLAETYLETRKRLLFEREKKIKKRIEKLKLNRRLLRDSQRRKAFPSVAIIGYTNSGKTSLIKALTQDEKLRPKSQLFATLDVTAHTGYLPCHQPVIFVDTVGFITDIPTDLIQSFTATLDDISIADLIIHVWDASHPDLVNQRQTVQKTLEELSLPPRLLGTVLHVGNKIDLVQGPQYPEEGELLISATKGTGIPALWEEVQRRLTQTTGMLFMSARVPNGGEEMSWLKSWCAIQEILVDPEDPNFLILNIVCRRAVINMFQKRFGLEMREQQSN